MKIKLTKLSAIENLRMPTLNWEEYIPGLGPKDRPGPPPVDYFVEGVVSDEETPEIGKPFNFLRTSRNGVEYLGLFSTTEVTEIDSANNLIYTKNSIYKLEYLDEQRICDNE